MDWILGVLFSWNWSLIFWAGLCMFLLSLVGYAAAKGEGPEADPESGKKPVIGGTGFEVAIPFVFLIILCMGFMEFYPTENSREEKRVALEKRISTYSPEEYIKEKTVKVDWDEISRDWPLSEEFIENNSDKVNWTMISICQNLSEDFIERNGDKVAWLYISRDQELSEDFIVRNRDRIQMRYIMENDRISEETKKKVSEIKKGT